MSMFKNFFRGCRYFWLGVIEMNRQKRMQTFTKVFPGIGQMTGRGVSINKSRGWFIILPQNHWRNNIKDSITEGWKDENDLQVFASLYTMMNEHGEKILDSVKTQMKDPDILKNVDLVEMELHNFDLDGKTRHQYVFCVTTPISITPQSLLMMARKYWLR